ncbi:hypothetical protein [Halosegnis longus]|uniref:hypothetical protein n=1 Tax=Halosegnis longus TaxID=2216012 RepID=UPI00129D2527|nr:hypothetical protein [Halosegnis longus]
MSTDINDVEQAVSRARRHIGGPQDIPYETDHSIDKQGYVLDGETERVVERLNEHPSVRTAFCDHWSTGMIQLKTTSTDRVDPMIIVLALELGYTPWLIKSRDSFGEECGYMELYPTEDYCEYESREPMDIELTVPGPRIARGSRE